MRNLLSSPPRLMTRAWETERKTIHRTTLVMGVAGLALIVVGALSGVPFPFCLWGMIVVIAAVVIRASGGRRLDLWLHGTEMLAEALPGKSWTLSWSLNGRGYSRQTSQMPLLWVDGRVRILVDRSQPSRMTPLGVEMLPFPESEEAAPIVEPALPPRPRKSSPLVLTEARQRRTLAVVAFVSVLVVACLVTPFVRDRQRFLAEAVETGRGTVTGRTSSMVEYQFDGSRRIFEARGKSQARWPVGATVRVYRHQGLVVAETELPGMPLTLGMVFMGLPILAAVGILASAVAEARRAQRLWRFGKEVPAELISDQTRNQRREVICQFSSAGLSGVTRREFAATRRLLEGARGELVVLVDPRNPNESRVMLADEA